MKSNRTHTHTHTERERERNGLNSIKSSLKRENNTSLGVQAPSRRDECNNNEKRVSAIRENVSSGREMARTSEREEENQII